MNIKEEILTLWKQVQRPGIDILIDFLDTSDFFTAPCSTQYHLAKPSGLAEHSLNVYKLLMTKFNQFAQVMPGDFNLLTESVIICGLGHDLCKVNYYQEGGEPCSEAQYKYLVSLTDGIINRLCSEPGFVKFVVRNPVARLKREIPSAQASILIDWLKNRPSQPMPELPMIWSVIDQFPLGHGEKSVSILQDFIPMTDVEKLSIRWHMTAFDPSIHFNYPNGYAYQAAVKVHPLVTMLFTADFEASNIIERDN